MTTIYKYPISILAPTLVSLPLKSRILTAQMQGRVPCVWALVDTDSQRRDAVFEVFGTGWGMPEDPGAYVGTIQQDNFVWHVFMRWIYE